MHPWPVRCRQERAWRVPGKFIGMAFEKSDPTVISTFASGVDCTFSWATLRLLLSVGKKFGTGSGGDSDNISAGVGSLIMEDMSKLWIGPAWGSDKPNIGAIFGFSAMSFKKARLASTFPSWTCRNMTLVIWSYAKRIQIIIQRYPVNENPIGHQRGSKMVKEDIQNAARYLLSQSR